MDQSSYIPNSFCSICTKQVKRDIIGLLFTLSINHPNSKCYLLLDTETNDFINLFKPFLNIDIFVKVCLDYWSCMNRNEMERDRNWVEFQMKKSDALSFALENESDTLFLDSDIFLLKPINCIDKTKALGASPHYIRDSNHKRFGYYNGGVLWTNDRNLPNQWVKYSKTSRYYDQAAIEDLVKENEHSYFEFGEEYNVSWWRMEENTEPVSKMYTYFSTLESKLFYKTKEVGFVHTHFTDPLKKEFNQFIVNKLIECKRYKELIILNRIIKDKWIIDIPKQPLPGIWNHTNDSFRELVRIWEEKYEDLYVKEHNCQNVFLEPNICLYDRPSNQWFNDEVNNAFYVLLGNNHVNKEGKEIKHTNVAPWIFWARRPRLLENLLKIKKYLSYHERTLESVFIGNIENSVQNRYRNDGNDWSKYIKLFELTNGNKHIFTQEEYFDNLRNSKYGLSLRGFGSKCHREVECLSWGTVLIVASDVNTDSYIEPLIEGVHYIRVQKANEIPGVINSIDETKWTEMSKAGIEWFMRNCHSDNSWKLTLRSILYKNSHNTVPLYLHETNTVPIIPKIIHQIWMGQT